VYEDTSSDFMKKWNSIKVERKGKSVSNRIKTPAQIGKKIHGKLDMNSTFDTYFFKVPTNREAPHLALKILISRTEAPRSPFES
jgi:hypothetical protein